MIDNDLAAVGEILEGFVEVSRPAPAAFEQFVHDRVADRTAPTRPAPTPAVDPFAEINSKLDEILGILKEGRP